MTNKTFKRLLLISLVLRVVLAFLPSPVHSDLRNSLDWGERFFLYGTKNYYLSNVWSFDWPNQPPGTVYLYALINYLHEIIYKIFWFINVNIPPFPSNIMYYFERDFIHFVAKIPTIIADFGIAFFVYKLVVGVSDKKKARVASIVFLLNPVVWYNSVIWGQYESVNNLFAIASFYFLLRRRLGWAVVSFILSIYIKLSLIIFAPVFIIVALNQKYSPTKYLKTLLVGIVVTYLIFVPFSRGNTYLWIYDFYRLKVLTEQLQLITANAFNLWAGIAGIHAIPHETYLGPFTYKLWGNVLFIVSYLLIALALFRRKDTKSVFWSLSMVSISSFILLTNMHERYLYPFFVTFIVVAVLDKGLMVYYYLLSGISILNLYNFWWYPKLGIIILLLSSGDRLLPRILGFVSFILFLMLFRKFLESNDFSINKLSLKKKHARHN